MGPWPIGVTVLLFKIFRKLLFILYEIFPLSSRSPSCVLRNFFLLGSLFLLYNMDNWNLEFALYIFGGSGPYYSIKWKSPTMTMVFMLRHHHLCSNKRLCMERSHRTRFFCKGLNFAHCFSIDDCPRPRGLRSFYSSGFLHLPVIKYCWNFQFLRFSRTYLRVYFVFLCNKGFMIKFVNLIVVFYVINYESKSIWCSFNFSQYSLTDIQNQSAVYQSYT